MTARIRPPVRDFCSCFCSCAAKVQWPCTPSPSSTVARLRFTSATRPVTSSPSLCSAMYSSSDVGTQLLQTQPQTALLAIVLEHDGAHHLADFQFVLRMIDALLVHDVADMNHAFDIFGHLHERAELLELRNRPFDDRADRDTSSPRHPTDRPVPA